VIPRAGRANGPWWWRLDWRNVDFTLRQDRIDGSGTPTSANEADALGPTPRAELLHVLMLPDFDRADRIGEFWRYP
jgi:hypothetical protein